MWFYACSSQVKLRRVWFVKKLNYFGDAPGFAGRSSNQQPALELSGFLAQPLGCSWFCSGFHLLESGPYASVTATFSFKSQICLLL